MHLRKYKIADEKFYGWLDLQRISQKKSKNTIS